LFSQYGKLLCGLPLKTSHGSPELKSSADNTNADPETRAYWTELAKKHKVPIRCVLFTANMMLCEHNDTVRALGTKEPNANANVSTRTASLTWFFPVVGVRKPPTATVISLDPFCGSTFMDQGEKFSFDCVTGHQGRGLSLA
jgi:hypothetical protein